MRQETIHKYTFKPLPLGIEVKSLDFIKERRTMTEQNHRTDFHVVLYVEEGTLPLELDFEAISLESGTILYISPGQVYRFDGGGDYMGLAVLFTNEFLLHSGKERSPLSRYSLFQPLAKHTPTQLIGSEGSDLLALIREESYRTDEPNHRDIMKYYTLTLLLLLDRAAGQGISQSKDGLLERFCSAVEEHFTTRCNVSDYLEMLKVPEKLLARTLSQHLGIRPKAYIDQRRMLEAKRMLGYSTVSIKEIAYTLGFDEPTNFNKFFRKHAGLSPMSFRSQHQ